MLANPQDIKLAHRKAMKLIDKAILAKVNGDLEQERAFYVSAYELEKDVALSYSSLPHKKEPNRSILFRSAAVIAKNAELYEEAERMVAHGLLEVVHHDIAQELRDLYEKINFHRHLEIRGIVLSDQEVQLSLQGDDVSFGMIPMDLFINKIKAFESIAERKIERLYAPNKEYRSYGEVDKSIKEKLVPYLSIPRAASYAVTIRLGTKQLSMFQQGSLDVKQLIDEILEEINLVNNSEFDKIKTILEKENIKDKEPYLKNLITLVQRLAPDGKKIKLVGLSVNRGNKTKTLPLTKTRANISNNAKLILAPIKQIDEVVYFLSGILQDVYGRKGSISITNNKDETFTIDVPKGLEDLVKENFNSKVSLKVHKKGNKYTLVEVLE